MKIKQPPRYLHPSPIPVGQLQYLSTLMVPFAAVGTVPPVMAKNLADVSPNVTEISVGSLRGGAGPCDAC